MTLKERYTKALRKKVDRGFAGYPVATVAYYGPDDNVATKVAVGIIPGEDQEPIAMERWVSAGGDLRRDHEVNEKILLFIRSQGAKSVVSPTALLAARTRRVLTIPRETSAGNVRFGPTGTAGVEKSSTEDDDS